MAFFLAEMRRGGEARKKQNMRRGGENEAKQNVIQEEQMRRGEANEAKQNVVQGEQVRRGRANEANRMWSSSRQTVEGMWSSHIIPLHEFVRKGHKATLPTAQGSSRGWRGPGGTWRGGGGGRGRNPARGGPGSMRPITQPGSSRNQDLKLIK